MSEIKERLILLSKALNLSPNAFSESIGRDRAFVKSIKNYVRSDALENIITIYPNVNLTWIIMGKGDIFHKEESENALFEHYRSENIEFKNKIDALNREIGRLEARIEELKKETAHPEDNAECADVKRSGSEPFLK